MVELYNYKLRFIESNNGNKYKYIKYRCKNMAKFFVDELNHNESSISLTYKILDSLNPVVGKIETLCELQTQNKLSDVDIFLLRNRFPKLIGFKEIIN